MKKLLHKILRKKIKLFLEKLRYRNPNKNDIIKLISRLRPENTGIELIRLGNENDGGYLVPDVLKDIEACFSPGVGNVTSFESACAKMGMKIYMADASVVNPVPGNPQYNFIKKFIGKEGKDDFITLENWILDAGIDPKADLLLQMDIEGYEYEVLNSTSLRTLKRFKIVVIEFHELHMLWNPKYFSKAKKAFDKLLKNHVCVHIHPNNCCGIKEVNGIEFPVVAEFSFLRKNEIIELGNEIEIPHRLDRNNTNKKTIKLPEIWYVG
ncbi:FkbM family methyltransferase [Antarcticibacterium arcticum]|uniref:FkbM family methyltransferase n=1 Tax=Antarcticibacterium arcticum TaxID=2585771 RepID=A0A5B8YKN6_9FLAO|nr:FkbM family methyltransferase [Antarcticibacterium arcticum]QED37768.1 FkbM family methyltransferase [Antarcticibacterium arcticum]